MVTSILISAGDKRGEIYLLGLSVPLWFNHFFLSLRTHALRSVPTIFPPQKVKEK